MVKLSHNCLRHPIPRNLAHGLRKLVLFSASTLLLIDGWFCLQVRTFRAASPRAQAECVEKSTIHRGWMEGARAFWVSFVCRAAATCLMVRPTPSGSLQMRLLSVEFRIRLVAPQLTCCAAADCVMMILMSEWRRRRRLGRSKRRVCKTAARLLRRGSFSGSQLADFFQAQLLLLLLLESKNVDAR